MTIAVVVRRLLLLLTTAVSVVNAFPSAAGACPGGVPAVAGTSHTDQGKKQTTGSLSDGNLVVLLNGVALGEEPTSFFVDQVHTLEVTGGSFKGFLVRMGPPSSQRVDLRDSLVPLNDTAQIASLTCVDVEQVGGLTHTDNTAKTFMAGSLLVTVPVQGLLLDITVVVLHDSSTSTFYYSNFVLNAIQEGGEEKATAEPTLLDESLTTINTTTNNNNNSTTSNNETQMEVDTDPEDDPLNTGGAVVVSATSGATTYGRNVVQNNVVFTLLVAALAATIILS